MNKLTIAFVATLGLLGAAGSAAAFSEASVQHTDVARVAATVQQLPAGTARSTAARLVDEAAGYINDGDKARAYLALQQARSMAQGNQIAEAVR